MRMKQTRGEPKGGRTTRKCRYLFQPVVGRLACSSIGRRLQCADGQATRDAADATCCVNKAPRELSQGR